MSYIIRINCFSFWMKAVSGTTSCLHLQENVNSKYCRIIYLLCKLEINLIIFQNCVLYHWQIPNRIYSFPPWSGNNLLQNKRYIIKISRYLNKARHTKYFQHRYFVKAIVNNILQHIYHLYTMIFVRDIILTIKLIKWNLK